MPSESPASHRRFAIFSKTSIKTLGRAVKYLSSSDVWRLFGLSLAQWNSGELGRIVLYREHAGNT